MIASILINHLTPVLHTDNVQIVTILHKICIDNIHNNTSPVLTIVHSRHLGSLYSAILCQSENSFQTSHCKLHNHKWYQSSSKIMALNDVPLAGNLLIYSPSLFKFIAYSSCPTIIYRFTFANLCTVFTTDIHYIIYKYIYKCILYIMDIIVGQCIYIN